MYNEKVMKEFMSPQNVGEVENANAVGEVGNASCGDIMKISMRIENGIIEEVKFQTYGCAAAVATSSIATKMIKGKTVDEALALTNQEVIEELGGLPAQKIHCSVLAEGAIKAAIKNYLENYKKEGNA
ncbi:MAG: iron-sulfur cluster assembly scaffold protein [Clostridia bacterium]|nr:iron-sulfur cluster assembly scaffold protein [Clostridia bacterium]